MTTRRNIETIQSGGYSQHWLKKKSKRNKRNQYPKMITRKTRTKRGRKGRTNRIFNRVVSFDVWFATHLIYCIRITQWYGFHHYTPHWKQITSRQQNHWCSSPSWLWAEGNFIHPRYAQKHNVHLYPLSTLLSLKMWMDLSTKQERSPISPISEPRLGRTHTSSDY